MLQLEVGQNVWLCTYCYPPREAVVEELDNDSATISFWTTSAKPAIAKFWLSNGLNHGNNAYWITDKEP